MVMPFNTDILTKNGLTDDIQINANKFIITYKLFGVHMETVAISEVPCTFPQLSQHSLAGMSMMGYGNIAKEGQDLNFVGIGLLFSCWICDVLMHSGNIT